MTFRIARGELNHRANGGREPVGGKPVEDRPVRFRLLEYERRRYIAYSAHDLIAGDHESGRPGHPI